MSEPSITYTFLFTDVAGSAHLWESAPEAMRAALTWHDALLRDTIDSYSGRVFKTVGDGVCAVFTDAGRAIAAALAAQRSFTEDQAGGPVNLRVRIALHSGVAEGREGDFFGPTVNRVARLLSLGHGGQILLSETACSLVRDALPVGTSLQQLGLQPLRDLARPEAVYQLCHPNLPRDFPALRAGDRMPPSWPRNLSSFVGREGELGDLKGLLEQAGLVTLVGPGGIGKTRLALRAAELARDSHPDGECFVSLADVEGPEFVGAAIARALEVRESGEQEVAQVIAAYLESRRFLLLLDNFEHVVAARPLVSTLLAKCPSLTVLVTSRTPLRLYGEREMPVRALSLPAADRAYSPSAISESAAVTLFEQRARAVQFDFRLTEENASAVANICVTLEGLPLAIELAAARIRILSPQALVARLEKRLQILTGGARDLPVRQQTLRATIDWSHALLSAEERALFRRLAVFRGGCTAEAAGAVSATVGVGTDILERLEALVEKSLLFARPGKEGEPRFLMLEAVREYAAEQLSENGEGTESGRRHCEFYLSVAEAAAQQLDGDRRALGLRRLQEEHDNCRAAFRWAVEGGEAELALRLANALSRFWMLDGHVTEGRGWVESALRLPPPSEDAVGLRAWALLAGCRLALAQDDPEVSRVMAEEALRIFEALRHAEGMVRSLVSLAKWAWKQHDVDGARDRLGKALVIAREVGPHATTHVLNTWGQIELSVNHFDAARALLTECRVLNQQVGNPDLQASDTVALALLAWAEGDIAEGRAGLTEGVALARANANKQALAHGLFLLGSLLCQVGDLGEAAAMLDECHALHWSMEEPIGVALALLRQGSLAARGGDLPAAESLLRESIRTFRKVGAKPLVPCFSELGELALGAGRRERAIRLLSVASALRGGSAFLSGNMLPGENEQLADAIARARASVDEETWDREWAAGQALSLDDAAAFALGGETRRELRTTA